MVKPVSSYENTVLVDMDGVLADFDGYILDNVPQILTRIARRSFYLYEDYPDHRDVMYEISGQPEFFADLPVYDNALEGWQRLIDLGYDPRICSAPMSHNAQSFEGKRAWLRRHLVPIFGEQVLKRAIIDSEKFKYEGIVLIDDRPNPDTNNGQAVWKHVVFDQEYNQNSAAPYRLHGWLAPDLPDILEHAKQAQAA